MRLLIIIVLVIIIAGGFLIARSNNLDLGDMGDIKILVKETFSWIGNIGSNIKSLVGLTVAQDWLPDANKTNKSNETG